MTDDLLYTIICVCIVVVLYKYVHSNTEGFDSKLSNDEIESYTGEIIRNKKHFSNLTTAKNKMPWMDPITYDDVKHLIRNNQFDRQNIMNILK